MKTPPLEKEVKFYINNLSGLEERLRSIGAVKIKPRTLELNYRFDTDDFALSRSQQALRLRKDDQIILTYKGPSDPDSALRIRTEIELVVDDFENAASFLEALGYTLVIQYEKWRTTYHLNGIEITLDEMPYGNFSEIEGEDEPGIYTIAGQLGLNWDCRINESYLALFDILKRKLSLATNRPYFL